MSNWIAAEFVRGKKCWVCGKTVKYANDVGEYRNLWPGPRTQVMCYACHMSRHERSKAAEADQGS